jgi:hypothetical protein
MFLEPLIFYIYPIILSVNISLTYKTGLLILPPIKKIFYQKKNDQKNRF